MLLAAIAGFVAGLVVGSAWRGAENSAISSQLSTLVEKRALELLSEQDDYQPQRATAHVATLLPAVATRLDR